MNGDEPDRLDRVLAWGLVFLLAVAALIYAPAVPFPTSLQRHAAATAGCALLAAAAAGALAGKGFPRPPLPLATLGIAAALGLTAALPKPVNFASSPGRAFLTAAAAFGLVGVAAVARSLSRTLLGPLLLGSAVAVGATVAAVGLAEALGLDPLSAARYYDSRENPVATLGNPDLVAEFLAPVACVAAGLALSSSSRRARALAMVAAALCIALLGRLGVRFGMIALAVGLLALGLLHFRRARALAPLAAVALLSFAAGAAMRPSPAEAPGSGAASRPALPPTLEVRLRVAVAAAKVALVFAPWGAGAGNFAIAFAYQRDPREIALSTHGRRDGAETVVDVAHNDPLQLIVEAGALGALALGALFVGLYRWGRRGVFSSQPACVAGLAALGVSALGRSPFYDGVASAILGAILLGVLGAGDPSPVRVGGAAGRALGAILLAALPYPAWLAARALSSDLLLAAERVNPTPGAERIRLAAERLPYDERPWLLLARRLRLEGNADGALAAYGEALERNPCLVEAHLNSGNILAERGNLNRARSHFEFCRLLDPEHPRLAYCFAQLARSSGNDAEAAADLERAAQLAPAEDGAGKRRPEELRAWGMALFEAGEPQRARPYLDRWVAHDPTDADAWFKLGSASLKRGDRTSADLEFSRAHRLYALEAMRRGDLEAALLSMRLYRKSAAPDDAGPWILEAAIRLAKKERAAAVAALARAEAEAARIDAADAARPELDALRGDAELGAKLQALTRPPSSPR